MKLAFCGFRHSHIFTLFQDAQQHAAIEIVGACEDDDATRIDLNEKGQVHLTHTTLSAMLDDIDCDAVAIGDYYGRRGELILQALEAGKHVIVDKPVCTSLVELKMIEAALADRNLKLGCMLDMRDRPQLHGLRAMIRDDLIGEIHAINFGGQHPLLLGNRAGWYFEPGKHGGTINDIAIHAIDVIPWITGLSFSGIQAARTWNAFAPAYPHFHDAAQVMLTMDNGCGVLGDVSYFMPNSMGYTHSLYWRMTFWGRKGVVETSMTSDQIMVAVDGEENPRYEPLPAGNPGGYLQAFFDDIHGKNPDLNTQTILSSARTVLQIQAAANKQKEGISLG